MSEGKSIGQALVGVFDAALDLVKTELKLLQAKVTRAIKDKGLGLVLVLAALAPLTIAVVFLLIGLYQVLHQVLGLPAWAASFIMSVLALLVAAGLVWAGFQKLGASDDEQE